MQAISLLQELWSKGELSAEGSRGSPLAWAEVARGQLCRCFWWGTPVCAGKNGRKGARRWGRERELLGSGPALTWCSTEVNRGGKERLDEVLGLGARPIGPLQSTDQLTVASKESQEQGMCSFLTGKSGKWNRSGWAFILAPPRDSASVE